MQTSVWRWASIILGLVTAMLGMWGAYQFGLKLEGTVSYLTIAAPVITGAAAIIPPLAEQAWRSKHYTKSLMWWAVLLPAAATVFFGAAERVHVAKAGAEAERSALRQEASRASSELAEAKDEALKAEARTESRGEESLQCILQGSKACPGRGQRQARSSQARPPDRRDESNL